MVIDENEKSKKTEVGKLLQKFESTNVEDVEKNHRIDETPAEDTEEQEMNCQDGREE